ncbi:MAG: L,D-transpeptidase family protein [Clostridia bacterium]|nr:L,D-transpeptidase family protein [Clostridia bacterium]
MKKRMILFAVILFSLFACQSVLADNTGMLTGVDLSFSLNPSIGTADSEAKLSLFDGNKTYHATAQIKSGASEAYAHFDVDPFAPGKDFKLQILSGFSTVKYYDYYFGKNENIELWTYTYVTEEGPVPVSSFNFYAMAEASKPVQYYLDFEGYPLSVPARYIDGVLYIPAAEGAKSMGVSNITYDAQTGNITYGIYDKTISMSIGSRTAFAFGNTYTLDGIPAIADGYPFIPLLSFADIVDADVIIQDEGDHINAVVSQSKVVKKEIDNHLKAAYINSTGISSETEYLIWVSKKEFKLRVYRGYAGNWEQINEFTCAIGKDSTPTCTGQFRYYSKEKIWPYSSYYVGPIMRFNGGYAIHTTLLRYNGVPYDNRVGMKLSHGCVRLQPQDMNWLINTVPLYSKVYITN